MDTIAAIRETAEYVGHYKIGPLNHFKDHTARIDWKAFCDEVTALMAEYKKEYHFNKSMQRLLGSSILAMK